MKYFWKRIRIWVWEFLSKTVNAHQNSSLYLFMCKNKSQCIFAHSDSFHKRCHIYMGEKWRLSEWKKGKGHNQVVTSVSLFKWESFYGIILYKTEHRNNSRRSQKLMELPDEELPLQQCWENVSVISPPFLTGLLQWTQWEKQQLAQIISATWEISSTEP